MSSRKEQLKKSLGITEYPWSSDDEDQPMPDVHLLRRQAAEPRPSVADMPGTSGQTAQNLSSSSLTPAKRNEADAFWSIINYQNKPIPAGVSRTRLCDASRPTPNTPASDMRERAERMNAAADIQRILAIKKITQNRLGALRPNRSNTSLYSMSSRGLTGPSRNPLFSPTLTSATIRAHQNALRRLQANRNAQAALTNRCSGNNTSTPERIQSYMGMLEFPRLPDRRTSEPVQPSTTTPTQAETDLSSNTAAVRSARSENPTTCPETNELDTPNNATGGMSLEEEIVEIDAQDEADGNNAIENTTQNNVVNADVELNQVVTLDADDESKRLQQERRREGNLSPEDAEPFTVKEFNQSLLRLLECPVCLEWMEPPMSQCRRGHLVCGRCRARLASCPVCRTTFSSVRNRAMEGVAEMVRYPCRHMCGREVRLRRRAAHEASCGARRYACPAPACSDRPPLPREQLAQHFQSKHMTMLKIGRKHKFSMKVNSEQHDTWVIAALHEYFSLRVDVDIRTWGIIVYVAYIGPKCNAKNFTYEVSVIGQHKSRKLVYCRSTHSDLESSSLNVSRQDCFHLTLDQALNFLRVKNRHCEPDKFLDFNVEISKSEIESRDDSDS
ncbi:unnamed protein product [Diatraea saccharalis]|uniref:E3 ubiquitin-protein ligase n=1 Tax=Diatraea saccharalis TaxID=40085 RepID=A0A9N9W7S8_9NEOP|nr:unnamed protein product [Diatraea saccharalis]